jgi:hypothetical protein
MTYRVEFVGTALVQLNGLPSAIFDALVKRVVILVEEPWDADLKTPADGPPYRQTTFGAGYGLLSFSVDDRLELIRIVGIAWIG